MKDKMKKLESLIENYNELQSELNQMIINWEQYSDPLSDQGLRYEKECQMEKAYEKIKQYISEM